jgi:murein DD-endopeptidase MepM/ murein hydrolase activator NlpD
MRALRKVAVWLGTLAALAAAAAASPGVSAEPAPSKAAAAGAVVPGGVVRWGGEGTERCGMEGERWEPIASACWYPVDLLRRPGGLTVERWAGGRWSAATVEVGRYPYAEQRLTIADESKVDLSAADLARVERENARIGKLWALRTPRRFTLPLAAPLAALPDGGRFGARRVINGQPKSPHTGADYAAAAGTPVLAPAAGTVVLAGDFFFSGNSVFVNYGDGLITMVFHLSEIDVKEGEEVRAGQRLGRVGSTGRATGPHLHFGVRWRGARVDPEALLGPVAAVPEVGR